MDRPTAPPPASLTARELAALHIITAELDGTGATPSLRQLAALLGLKAHSGADRLLSQLERAGWVRRDRPAAHSLTLLHRPPAAWAVPDDQRPTLAAMLRNAADRLDAQGEGRSLETTS